MRECYHCGELCKDQELIQDHKSFCCRGCVTVYEILSENNLDYYYELEKSPGTTPKATPTSYEFLDHEKIVADLVEFDNDGIQVVNLEIPAIHCSSCIWILENLKKLHAGIRNSQVDFPKKQVRVTFAKEEISLKELVLLLGRLGYEPTISLEQAAVKKSNVNRTLIYQLGVAGFAFGNVMFLSFPEYFQVDEFWLDRFKNLFRWLMFAFTIPVVFYSAKDYFISAFKGLRSRILTIDVPIALGVSVLFIRSTLEIIMDWGTGFFDSLTGLVFFLLVGKYFQQKTYAFLSFERDYKSYFPIGITRILEDGSETQIPVYEVEEGQRLLIRNKELIPVDAKLLKGNAFIDYSFVTGEAVPVYKLVGDKLYAGGRQEGGSIEVEVHKKVSQSYLTQLWSNSAFEANKEQLFESLTNKLSKYFTYVILGLALVAGLFWAVVDSTKVFQVITAVLIVACPCAIALAAPFTLGNLLRFFGKNQCYIKDTYIIEQLANIDTIVFDKTGTLTMREHDKIEYEGIPLTAEEVNLLSSSLRASNHPLSRSLYELLKANDITTLDSFVEEVGAGIHARYQEQNMKIGSPSYVEVKVPKADLQHTSVYVRSNNDFKGRFIFQNAYRTGLESTLNELGATKELVVLSGDNDSEKERLKTMLPKNSTLFFNQKPADKMNFIKKLQQQGKKVMMVGDGLNDAGALAQSDVGIAISENVNVFSPACDGILKASNFNKLPSFFKLSEKGVSIIKWSFMLSFLYNLVGLGFAVSGNLSPVVAAILMPLSSISIVVFTTVLTHYFGQKLLEKNKSE